MFERKPSTTRWARRRVRTRREPTPEWMTERWQHTVEAEARGRLKRKVRDVAAHLRPPAARP